MEDENIKRSEDAERPEKPDLMNAQEALDDDDVAAIEEAEEQITRGEDLDWREVSERLRRKFGAE